MPQPSNITPLEAARAKQLAARRKIQALPNHPPKAELPNINWHDHYIKRVAK
jgi:hypothetical protein